MAVAQKPDVVHLYEYTEQLAVIDGWIDEHAEAIAAAGGELPAELVELLDGAIAGQTQKLENVMGYVISLEATAAAVALEEKRLAQRRKALEAKAARLRDYAKLHMETTGRTSIDGALLSLRIQKNPPSVRCALTSEQLAELYFTAGALPGDCITEVPASYALDKRAVLERWKSGGELPAGIAVEQGTRLVIR
jgi:hypothetical protein